MPITITPNVGTSGIGPMLGWHFQSDFIGPIPIDAHWDWSLQTSGETNNMASGQDPSHGFSFRLWRLYDTAAGQTIATGNTAPAAGTQVRLDVTLNQANGAVIDSGSITAPWQPVDNIGAQINIQGQAQGGGGLTVEEHGWLDQVQTFINNTAQLAGTIGQQLIGGGILDHVSIGLANLCGSSIALTGRGELVVPPFTKNAVNLGLAITVTSAPPGAGLRDGAVLEYVERVVQLCTLHRTLNGSVDHVTEINDVHADNTSWLWRNSLPRAILFDVTPGWTVSVTYLCFDGSV